MFTLIIRHLDEDRIGYLLYNKSTVLEIHGHRSLGYDLLTELVSRATCVRKDDETEVYHLSQFPVVL